MINRIAGKIEQNCTKFKIFGKKVFDVQELDAQAYHRKVGNNDVFTILDKDHNKLLVQNIRVKNAKEQESVTKFFSPDGSETTIKTTITNMGN